MRKIYKTWGILFLLLGFIANAGAQLSPDNNNDKETNLFRYGEPLTSCETNLKNLFVNFPKFISNTNIELLDYKYVGIIKNQKQAKYYLKKNIHPNAPSWTAISGNDISLDYNALDSKKYDLDEIIKTISNEYIHAGDEVYMIRFVMNLVTHNYYFFINPQTKQIVTKGNMFAFKMYPETLNKPNE